MKILGTKTKSEAESKKEIYYQMLEAGVPIDGHESDLYVPVTPETTKIVNAYEFKDNVDKFKNNIDGKLWYDIPFAYIPFWDKKRKSSKTRASGYNKALPVDFPELDVIVKEAITEAIDKVGGKYEAPETNVNAVEYQGRDGFIPYTDGGYTGDFIEPLDSMIGSGKFPKNEIARNALQDQADPQEMENSFIWDYRNELVKAFNLNTEEDIDTELIKEYVEAHGGLYNALEETDLSPQSEFSDYESSWFSDMGADFQIGVNFFDVSNSRNQNGEKPEFYVFASINWESPYYRDKKGYYVITHEEDIVTDDPTELKAKLEAAMVACVESLS